jgi:hypothetical protein
VSWAQHLADITLFAAVMLDIFPETRWLANLIGVADMDTSGEDDAAPDASTRDAGAEHASRERWPHDASTLRRERGSSAWNPETT